MAVDIRGGLRKLAKAEKQIAFAQVMALTAVAKEAAGEVNASTETVFDVPTAFTKKATTFIPARKGRPVAYVLVKDIQAGYLARQETGGRRRAVSGAPIVIPVNTRVNRSGNIPRGGIAKMKAKAETFVATKDAPRTKHLRVGIYRRFKGRRGKAPRPPRLMVAFESDAQYRKRFGMRKRVNRVVQTRFRQLMILKARAAFASAR